jgi:hypothetical protein
VLSTFAFNFNLRRHMEAEYLLHKQTTGMVLGTERPVSESEAELHRALDAAERRAGALREEW